MATTVIAMMTAMAAAPTIHAAPDCRYVRDVTIHWNETHRSPVTEQKFEHTVIPNALREAVREGVGLEIRSLTDMQSTTTNSKYMEKINEIAYQRVQGFILSYKLLKNRWDPVHNGEQKITLWLKARVCVPYESSLPEVVTIQTFQWDSGRPDVEATRIAAASVPESSSIVLSSKNGAQGYHDIVITGHISTPEIYRVDRSAEIATVSHYLGAYAVDGTPNTTNKMRLTLSLEALFVADQTKVAEVITVAQKLPPAASRTALAHQLLVDAVRKAMPVLASKIVAHGGG